MARMKYRDPATGEFVELPPHDHEELPGRGDPDQHPIDSITGLQSALDGKAAATHSHNYPDLPADVARNGYVDTGDAAAKQYADQQDDIHSGQDRQYADQQDDSHSTADRAYTDAGLAGKAASVHTHTESEITDLGPYITEADHSQIDHTGIPGVGGGGGGGDFLPLSGGTLTGNLSLPSLSGQGPEAPTVVSSAASAPAYSTSVSVAIPAGVQPGDVLLLGAMCNGNSNAPSSVPPGFAVPAGFPATAHVGQYGTNRPGGSWYAKVADAGDTEGSTLTVTHAANEYIRAGLLVIRNAEDPALGGWKFSNLQTPSDPIPAGTAAWPGPGMQIAAYMLNTTSPNVPVADASWGDNILNLPTGSSAYHPNLSWTTGPVVEGPSPEVDYFTAGIRNGLLFIPLEESGAAVLVGSAVDMQGNEVVNAADPTTPQSLATRAYTDAEVDRGVQEGIAEHVSLLSEAAWWVDAADLTPGGDGLRDRSGNGRDAMFGADAAAPLVLPWDGEDYLHIPAGSSQYARMSEAVPDYVSTCTIEMDVQFDEAVSSSYRQLWSTLGGYAPLHLVYARTNNALVVYYCNEAGQVSSIFAAYKIPVGRRVTVRVDCTPTGFDIYEDGVHQEHKDWVHRQNMEPPRPNAAQIGGQLASDIDGPYRIYRETVTLDGVVRYDFDPANASDDYSRIANTGTAGGDWTISRAATGFKTAVVDRPLILFGGGQWAAAAEGIGHVDAATVVIAFRQWRNTTVGQQWFDMGFSTGATEGMGWVQRADGQSNPGDTLAIIYTSSLYTQGLGALPSGRNVLATAFRDGYRAYYQDGVLKYQGTLSGGMTPQPPHIGCNTNKVARAEMEFLAAAVWDRALTDEEIAEASDLLAGRRGPHPQYALKSELDALPMPGQWEQAATWAALPATGNWPGRRVRVLDGLGLCLAVWDGTGWRVDAQSNTGKMNTTPRPEFQLGVGGGTVVVFWVARSGGTVSLHLRTSGVHDFPGSPTRIPLWDIPSGWAPGMYSSYGPALQGTHAAHFTNFVSAARLDLLATGAWNTSPMYGLTSWPTTDPWPTSPPA